MIVQCGVSVLPGSCFWLLSIHFLLTAEVWWATWVQGHTLGRPPVHLRAHLGTICFWNEGGNCSTWGKQNAGDWTQFVAHLSLFTSCPRAKNEITPRHRRELFNSIQMNYSTALIMEDWWTWCCCLFGSVSGWIAVKMGTYLCSPPGGIVITLRSLSRISSI